VKKKRVSISVLPNFFLTQNKGHICERNRRDMEKEKGGKRQE